MKKKKIFLIIVSCLIMLSVTIGSFVMLRPPKAEAATEEYIQATETQGLNMSKTVEDNGDGTYMLKLDTYTTKTIKYIRETIYAPVDIVFVVDMSTSMKWSMDGKKKFNVPENETRIHHTKEAIKGFLNEMENQAKDHSAILDSRISLIKFAAGAEVMQVNEKNISDIMLFNNSKINSEVTDAINDLGKSLFDVGTTRTDLALSKAKSELETLITNHPQNDRKRIVVLFTDGNPTRVATFDEGVADTALGYAKEIKEKSNTTIYCVALSSAEINNEKGQVPNYDGNGQNTDNNLSRFLQYVSSSFETAIKMDTSYDPTAEIIDYDFENDGPIYKQYCFSGAEPESLNNAFETLAKEIIIKEIISEEVDGSTVLRDYITPYFELDTDREIKVYTYDHIKDSANNTKDSDGNPLFSTEKKLYAKATVEVSTNIISVRGLNYGEGVVTDIIDGSTTTCSGYKYSVEIPIKVKRGFLGGNNVPTNEEMSGVYSDERELKPGEKVILWGKFDVPKVDVPIKSFTFTLPDKNIYANTYYKEDDLIFMYPVCEFDGGKIDFSKINYGLEEWQNRFVTISRENTIPLSEFNYNTRDSDGLIEYDAAKGDGRYGVSVYRQFRVNDIVSSSTITISAAEQKDNGVKDSKYRAETTAKVFYPEITFADLHVPIGTHISSLFNYSDPVSYKKIVWKNGNTLSTDSGIVMSGSTNVDFMMSLENYSCFNYVEKDGKATFEELPLRDCEKDRIFYDTSVRVSARDCATGYYEAHLISFVHEKCNDEEMMKDGYHFIVHTTGLCKLTVTKAGSSEEDVNQSHVFYIISQDHLANEYDKDAVEIYDKFFSFYPKSDEVRCPNDIYMSVIVHGNESKTVILPAGDYVVIEDNNTSNSQYAGYGSWSWRYISDPYEMYVSLDADTPEASLTFENQRDIDGGLSSGSWIVNEFTENGIVRKPG